MARTRSFVALAFALLGVAYAAASYDIHADHSSAKGFVEWAAARLVQELGALHESRGGDALGTWQDTNIEYCPNSSYFDFLPVYVAHLMPGVPTAFNGTTCFGEYTATLHMGTEGGNITLATADGPSSALCSDFMLFTSRERSVPVVHSSLDPSAGVTISSWAQYEYADVKEHGMGVFVMPCGVLGTVSSALKTVSLFNGKNYYEMQAANIDFLTERKIWQEAVVYNQTQDIDPSLIRSGDYFAVARLDGLDPMVMFGTGGHTGHSTLLVHDPTDGELYVCESTTASPFGVYWPPPYGIIRTPYAKWIQLAKQANYHLALLPLDAKHSAAFNETRFWDWFKTVEGQPYGIHTFLYTFLDTANPMANMPKPIENPGFSYILELLQRLLPNSTKTGAEGGFYNLFMQAMNHRMPTTCPDLHCVFEYLDSQTQVTTLGELTAIPEMDGWIYAGGNYSMVCSVFAFHGWKNAFGDFWPSPVEAGEQTPKDNYMTQLFATDYFTTDNCPTGLRTQPGGTYCQLMGDYVLNLPGYNTVPVHADMNNHCPAQWPGYFRCPAGDPTCC